tara:strand:+ start:115 stop:795 length:681 start_codon:yes stop_codon:yes gene_type:complete
MRNALSKYLGQRVLVEGWIANWEEIKDKDDFLICIKHPVIKKANKDLLFKDQELISKEEHINLFFPKSIYEEFKKSYTLHDGVGFLGVVYRYCRSDGTNDFGVRCLENCSIHTDLDEFEEVAVKTLDFIIASDNDDEVSFCLIFIREKIIPRLDSLEKTLEREGESVATFTHTVDEYKKRIQELRYQLNDVYSHLSYLNCNRAMRRLRRKSLKKVRQVRKRRNQIF